MIMSVATRYSRVATPSDSVTGLQIESVGVEIRGDHKGDIFVRLPLPTKLLDASGQSKLSFGANSAAQRPCRLANLEECVGVRPTEKETNRGSTAEDRHREGYVFVKKRDKIDRDLPTTLPHNPRRLF